MKKSKYIEKYKDTYATARHLVNGVVNAKSSPKTIIRDIHFVVYEVMYPREFSFSEQMNFIKSNGFRCVDSVIPKKLSLPILDQTLEEFKKKSHYVIDGIVIYHDKKYPVNSNKNPKHAFAYKKNYSVNTEVVNVVWELTRYGVFKPRVQIKEVIINNAHINYTSGFNGKYIKENNIGPGTKIAVTLSGEVIPYIVNVIKSTKAKMPDEEYEWNKTGVDIISKKSDSGITAKLMENFVKTLKMKGISLKTCEKIVDKGYTTIPELISLTTEDFREIGFGEIQSENIFNIIHNIIAEPIPVEKLMAASNIFGFGFGVRKCTMIMKSRPEIFKLSGKSKLRDEVLGIEGMGPETVDQFVDNLPKFIEFLRDNPIFDVVFPEKITGSAYKDQKVVFSGFRDEEMKKKIIDGGGEVVNSVSSKTTLLIVKEKNGSSKITKAEKLGIKVILKTEF